MAEYINLLMNTERKKSIYRERVKHLDNLTDSELQERYRFDREGILFIVDLIRKDIEYPSKKNVVCSPELQVLATLRYLATNAHQIVIGDSLGLSQKTICNCIDRVTEALSKKASQFICFPSSKESVSNSNRGFFELAGFPGVVGCVDGTHIRIMCPSGDDKAQYYCRKGYPSINMQGVCDYKRRFTHIVVRWPGCTHDSFILRQSDIWTHFENEMQGLILGDSGYPCRRWLLTPYPNPTTGPQRRFNAAQKTTRCIVEQAFGSLKRRWAILGSLSGCCRLNLKNVAKMITCCVILQNIAINKSQPDVEAEIDLEEANSNIIYHGDLETGNAYRDTIAYLHFT